VEIFCDKRLTGKSKSILELAKSAKREGKVPYVVLFIGPNGAGKTTTIAKLASMLTSEGVSCTIAAGDTFRAAAIEQIAEHASRLGVDVIKGAYGADPASVAFDAIAHAKSRKVDCVLIDTAGRQETNKSLIEELKKMARVSKPDLTVFVGESIAGNALLEQVREFSQAVKLDGIILTKLDCDAKGGNTLSILSETSIPVLYLGTGEAYSALVQYSPELVLSSILP
ncbi:MAG: signal recognition particle-docking protein FtsY, partial [Candidatus Micrarchaeaceae archaeon]